MGHDAELLAASGVGGEDQGIISNGSALDLYLLSLAGWTPSNLGNGQVVQGVDHFLYEDLGFQLNNVSRNFNYGLLTIPPNFFVYTEFVEFDTLRTFAQGERFGIIDIRFSSTLRFLASAYSDGIRLRPISGDVDYPATIPLGEKIKLTTAITHDGVSATCDFTVNETRIITGGDCFRTVGTPQSNGFSPAHVDKLNISARADKKLYRILVGDDYA